MVCGKDDDSAHFCSFGRSCQLRVANGKDMAVVLHLDEALWAATSVPADAFRLDRRFLQCLDQDSSGRITSDELKAAIRWLFAVLERRDGIERGTDSIGFTGISRRDPRGEQLRESARYLLSALDLDEETGEISLVRLRDFIGSFRSRPLNGDGVVCPYSTEEPDLSAYIRDAANGTGGKEDVSGCIGIDLEQVHAFQQAVGEQLAWRAAISGPQADAEVMVFGEETAELERLIAQQAGDVDHFFELCRAMRFGLGRFDSSSGMEVPPAEMIRWDAAELRDRLSALPIAKPTAEGVIPLNEEAVNPLFRDWVRILRTRLVPRMIGRKTDGLDEDTWMRMKAAFSRFRENRANERGTLAKTLDRETLRKYAEGDFASRAEKLLEADAGVGRMLEGMREIEKLLLYQANMLRFCNNFINFRQLYSTTERSLFEHGSAVIDGRWFNLALPVEDAASHAAQATRGGIFTLYFDVVHSALGKRTLALPAVAGGKGNLAPGKRGVFFDLDGNEWDGQISRIIENPISFREALLAPFVRLGQFVIGKIEGWSAQSEKKLLGGVDQLTDNPPTAVLPAGRDAAAGPSNGLASPAGVFVGLSLSFAALGSSLAFIARTLGSMPIWRLLVGLTGLVILLMVPLSIVAALKLWRQDLSDLLEAGGWAVNVRMRLTRAQRRYFTFRPVVPAGEKETSRTVRPGFLIALSAMLLVYLLYGLR